MPYCLDSIASFRPFGYLAGLSGFPICFVVAREISPTGFLARGKHHPAVTYSTFSSDVRKRMYNQEAVVLSIV